MLHVMVGNQRAKKMNLQWKKRERQDVALLHLPVVFDPSRYTSSWTLPGEEVCRRSPPVYPLSLKHTHSQYSHG